MTPFQVLTLACTVLLGATPGAAQTVVPEPWGYFVHPGNDSNPTKPSARIKWINGTQHTVTWVWVPGGVIGAYSIRIFRTDELKLVLGESVQVYGEPV